MRFIAALDFSETSNRVLRAVQTYADQLDDADVYLIHVEPPDPDFVGYAPGPQTVRDQVAQDFRSEHVRLQDAAKELEEKGLKVTPLLLRGPTSETIVDKAVELNADVIITGSHGHGLLHDILVGSTSAGILKKSPIPVLVIPARS